MMSQNGEHKTHVICICSFVVEVIEELNDMVPSRIGRYVRFLLHMLQHLEFENAMIAIITI